MTDAAPQVVIGLSAVVLAIRGGEIVVLTVRPEDVRTHRASDLRGLPFGPFDPAGHRTFELALRAFVNDQTGFRLGYVEQLYTFGDLGRGRASGRPRRGGRGARRTDDFGRLSGPDTAGRSGG